MAKRDYMILYRLQQGLSVLDMAIKCKTSHRIIYMLEGCDQDVTHPKIAKRVGKAYALTKEQTESLMPEHYRKSSPNYDPDKFRREFDVDKKERRIPSYVMLKKR